MTSNIRVVLDTNVAVCAALLPRSTPRRAFDQGLEYSTFLMSVATLAELNEVLRRPRFDRYLSEEELLAFLAAVLRESEMVVVTAVVSVCRDPKHDKFLQLAVSGAATHIISGDDDLLITGSVSRSCHYLSAGLCVRAEQRGVTCI